MELQTSAPASQAAFASTYYNSPRHALPPHPCSLQYPRHPPRLAHSNNPSLRRSVAPSLSRLPKVAPETRPRRFASALRIQLISSYTMASSSVMRTAVVVMAVISSVAVMANAQAPAPAPTSAGSSMVPSVLAPVVGMVVALIAGRMMC